MRIAVLGGTGCGGRAIVGAARERGHEVLSIARGTTGKPDAICDRGDRERLARILDAFGPTVLVDHVAYGPREVEGALAALPPVTSRYILISSAVVYGRAREAPYREQEDLDPVGPLATMKRQAEGVAMEWGGGEREVICARLAWLYGPGHAPLTPWGREPRLVQMLHGRERLPIPTGDPAVIQPWFAADHGQAILALTAGDDPPPAINLGSETVVTWSELLAAWAAAAEAPAPRLVEADEEAIAERAHPSTRPFLSLIRYPPILDVGLLRELAPGRRETPLVEGCQATLGSG